MFYFVAFAKKKPQRPGSRKLYLMAHDWMAPGSVPKVSCLGSGLSLEEGIMCPVQGSDPEQEGFGYGLLGACDYLHSQERDIWQQSVDRQ